MTKLYSQIESKSLLSALVTSSARVAVLRVFLIDPLRSYYQRQLEAATGLAIRAVQRELERLSASGLLYRRMEGKRAYYSIDTGFAGFNDLRGLYLVGADPLDRLRAGLSVEANTHLLFKNKRTNRVLLVTRDGSMPEVLQEIDAFKIVTLSTAAFLEKLEHEQKTLQPFLKTGEDLLGRREDIVWRRIEAAGFQVDKGKGIP
jgi:DNA-binding transcriptional ArsR family regulator